MMIWTTTATYEIGDNEDAGEEDYNDSIHNVEDEGEHKYENWDQYEQNTAAVN